MSVPTVNLLLTPAQAEIMSLASNEARIQLVLRNPTDKEEAKTAGDDHRLICLTVVMAPPPPGGRTRRYRGASGAETAAASASTRAAQSVAAAPPPPINVEVIHGSSRSGSGNSGEDQIKTSLRGRRKNEFSLPLFSWP